MAKCLTKEEIEKSGGQLIHNGDGTVSVFMAGYPINLTMECCKALSPDYIYDIDNQACRWSTPKESCGFSEPINLVVNPKGNDGSLFFVNEDDNDTCTLDVQFDYLFNFKCEDLLAINQPGSILNEEQQNQISILTAQYEQILVQIQSVTNEILLLNSQLSATPYSIECVNTSLLSEPLSGIVATQDVSNFEKTGFGSKTANLKPASDESINLATSSIIYCLTDVGLQYWEIYLGPVQFAAYLNGDPNSYTCSDVITFGNLDFADGAFYRCNIPFGTRTILNNMITNLSNTLINLNAQAAEILSQINALEAQGDVQTSSCQNILEGFKNLNVSMTIEVVNSDNTLTTVFEAPLISNITNLYDYIMNNQQTGFYVCGGPSCNSATLFAEDNEYACDIAMDDLVKYMFPESGFNDYEQYLATLPPSAFTSSWLTFTTAITDTTIIDLIKNKKIKLNIKINSACGNFCVWLDNIKMNQQCSHVERTDILISKNPGFDFKRVVDNKKSWSDTSLTRKFLIESVKENNAIRQTNYNVNDERLVLNSKEIDLDVNIATAIETDVWKFILDNPCLLTGETLCNPCELGKDFQDEEDFFFQDEEVYAFMDSPENGGSLCCGDNRIKFNELITTDLSTLTTIEDFTAVISGELIDAKNRQTITSYATLKALYNRYLNSIDYCETTSSGFDYYTIEKFASLIGDYWIDIIEQVVPSTSIWGSVKIYTNTLFDEQKFKYKSYSSLFCGNPFDGNNVASPINGTSGLCESVQVKTLMIPTDVNLISIRPKFRTCNSICIAQMNHGSEFIGTVRIDGTAIL